MDWLLWAVAVFSCLLALGYIQLHRRYQQRNRDTINQRYHASLKTHGIEAAQICRESLNLGHKTETGIKPFEVYRILHVCPDRWYLYLHVEGSEPLIKPISQKRATSAVAQ
ncbi:hypothetical protein BVL52_20780 [Pseudomonas oryzihabitans]|uniref:DUF3301 domain-containing protein n=1 Tax=Pseudomonas oryzihabitans TaxID=47885 RepID=A0ABX3IQQ2_9PSED|nr:hypothetical protein BVL52_20780 [Pseudomonas psychrotolerans]